MGCNCPSFLENNEMVNESLKMPNQPYLTLNSNYKIPQYGLGVFQIEGNEAT